MEKKQSSVEWLLNNLLINGFLRLTENEHKLYKELREQARAMHKQEYIDAWMNGQNDSGYSQKELRQMAEEDYNQTYGDGKETK